MMRLPMQAPSGKRIREAREQAGLSQVELGAAVGVRGEAVSGYERGTASCPASRARKIARALGVPLSALYDGRAPKELEQPPAGTEVRDLLAALSAEVVALSAFVTELATELRVLRERPAG